MLTTCLSLYVKVGAVSKRPWRDSTLSPDFRRNHRKILSPSSFTCQLVVSRFELEVQLGKKKKAALSVKIPFLNMETPCVTPLRGYSPRIQTLRSEKEPLLWTQVSSYQRQCRSDVFSRVYYTATKQCLQRLAGLEAMRKNSAPLRLSETL